jgi:hypothetical protein
MTSDWQRQDNMLLQPLRTWQGFGRCKNSNSSTNGSGRWARHSAVRTCAVAAAAECEVICASSRRRWSTASVSSLKLLASSRPGVKHDHRRQLHVLSAFAHALDTKSTRQLPMPSPHRD